jgi:hypothetical protein
MDTGLTTLRESDIEKYISTANSMIERVSVLIRARDSSSATPIAGTRRRFVSTVSSAPARSARKVNISRTIAQMNKGDTLLSIPQHNLLFRLRRALAVALAVRDVFARQSELEALEAENRSAPLQGENAAKFHKLMSAASFVTQFTAASYLLQTLEASEDAGFEPPEPHLSFDSPHEGLKHLIYGLDNAITGAPDDTLLISRARMSMQALVEALMARKGRFEALGNFEDLHIRLDRDDFELNGLDLRERGRSGPLVMNFKKPSQIIGNHIAKYQAIRLAKMLMAYDFDRQMNPFVELGGFLFTFIGDGAPGTGKTILIQMIAGLVNDYCQMAGYGFHYENFGVDQISSYQGKSGQNCKQFVTNVMDPRVIGFGTVDDIDQVAARRSDDKASAGQQEVTAVLMESFAGAGTVVRGNCSFGMFSNYPENVDDALRQRAGARWLVDGPQTREDYIDIFALLLGSNHDIALGKHELYATQEIKRAVSAAYGQHAKPQEEGLARIFDRYVERHGEPETLKDVGLYLYAIKQAEPRLTGRAVKNITDAIKMRAMDFELPDEWFENPETFLHRPYDEKRDMIAELQIPVTMEMIMQEINRYADSEFRYTDKSDAAAVENHVRDQRVRERAAAQIRFLKEAGQWNV